ncbi:MAG: EAL domain-containing protein [bacterium]|nr:EAL domain-containing protein [bacterium]
MEFRDALKRLRSELAITQMELANALKINFSTISRWELGKNYPTRSAMSSLMTYAKTMDISETCLKELTNAVESVAYKKQEKVTNSLFSVEHASLRELIDDALFSIYVCDIETNEILYANHETEKHFGRSLEHLLQHKCYECFMSTNTPCEFCKREQLTEAHFTELEAYIPADGKTYYVLAKLINWKGRKAQIRYIMNMSHSVDSTIQKEQEKNFREQLHARKGAAKDCIAMAHYNLTKNTINDIQNQIEEHILTKQDNDSEFVVRGHSMQEKIMMKDELTGIYDRKTFFQEAAEMIKEHEAGYYALVCFDIDKFKVINDQYGMDGGDDVLRFMATTIQNTMNEVGGICARFNADDFALLYPQKYIDSDYATELHEKIRKFGKRYSSISISIGRYIVDDLSLSINTMCDRALMALNSVKGDFEKRAAFYDESMRTKLLLEQKIINEMQDALDTGQFEPWLQPQYNHETGAMIGAEALVRWRHPEKGLVAPYLFIPIFERNGFIYKLDQYIWEQCCILLRKWIDEGQTPLPVSVNVSRYDALRSDFFETITGIVQKYSIPAEMFRIEITESAFTETSEQLVSVIKKLIDHGYTLEIDDFGSGYSSLNTLKDVPAQVLKLDMRFFSKTDNENRSGNIVESIVRMAKWLGMSVVAEGVEEKEQADYLRSIGCCYIQEYYYAKPMPVMDYEKLMLKTSKESQMTRLETLETLNNNEFWNPKSMETLIFNSYVGGACIFEYYNGQTELLRINERYKYELGKLVYEGDILGNADKIQYLGDENRKKMIRNIENAIISHKESSCELVLSGIVNHQTCVEYINTTVRAIARAGDHYLFYCVIVNTTERHLAEQERLKAEKKQLESAARLEVIMKNINGGVSAIIINDDGTSKLIFNNDKYYELYGYTREQALEEQLDIMMTILPDDFPSVLEKINQLKVDKIPVIIDYRITRRDGRVANLRANASLMNMEGYGDVITSVITDVTEILSLQEQLRVIVENINGGVTATVIRDGKPEFVIMNDKFFQMLGYQTREEYEQELPDKYTGIHPDDRERVIAQFETSDGGKQQYTMEYRVIRKDGEIRYIRNNISIVSLFGIEEPVKLSVANDITDVYRVQQSEREALEQLTFLNQSAHDILEQPDSDQAVNDTLDKLRVYFGADRGYVVELDYENHVSSNTYESCADGVSSEMGGLRNIPFLYTDSWLKTLENKKYLIIEDVEQLSEDEINLQLMLTNQGIHSLVLVALFRDRELFGFIGVDNPSKATKQIRQMTALADYIAILLTRRDLTGRIERDHHSMELLVKDMPGGLVTFVYIDGKTKIQYCNERFYEWLGYRKEDQLTLDDLMNMVYQDDLQEVINYREQLLESTESISCVFRCHDQNGGIMWVNLKAAIAAKVKGAVIINAVFMDVSELQREKERLQKSEETARQNYEREMQLREETMKDSISCYQVNITQGIVEEYHSVNENWQNIRSGDQVDENLRKRILDGIVEEDHELVRNTMFSEALLKTYQKGKTSIKIEFRSVIPGLGIRWTQGTATIMQRHSGDLIALIDNKDIDIKKKDQMAVDAIMNEEIEAVAVVNADSGIAHFAQLTLQSTGMKIDEDFVYHERFQMMLRHAIIDQDQKKAEQFFDLQGIIHALEKEEIIRHIFRIRTSEGVIRHKKARAFYIDDTHQEIAIIGRDITDLYEEEQRQHRELRKAADAANKANQAKSEFLSRMSHDMRTPLNAILSFSNDEIIDSVVKEQNKQYLRKIHYAGEYLSGIISDILDMSQIEQNKMQLKSEPYSYDEFYEIINDVIAESCRKKNIQFDMKFEKITQWIATDKTRLNQIFINLLSNAVKFTKPGGHIEFISYSLPASEDHIDHRQFIIRDNGIGMSKDFIPRAFHHFEQENREQQSENNQGTGLGLPIVKKIVELMHGTITLESEEGKGTTFTVELPFQAIDAPASEDDQDDTSLDGVRILLCEDNEINVEIAKMLLESQGCIVESAENGQIGLELFNASKPDYYQAVLMDIRMPVMNGYAATKEIRKLDRDDAKRIPIIALSADAFTEDVRESADVGMDAYLSKPIDEKLLYKILKKLTR